jgi:hypothetical protein
MKLLFCAIVLAIVGCSVADLHPPKYPTIPGVHTSRSTEGSQFGGFGYDMVYNQPRARIFNPTYGNSDIARAHGNQWAQPETAAFSSLADQYSIFNSMILQDDIIKSEMKSEKDVRHWGYTYHYSGLLDSLPELIISDGMWLHVDGRVTGYFNDKVTDMSYAAMAARRRITLFTMDSFAPSVLRAEMHTADGSMADSFFAKEAALLPPFYHGNESMYEDFIWRFGTHYAASADFGAELEFSVFFNSSEHMSSSLWASASASIDLVAWSCAFMRADADIRASINATFSEEFEVMLAARGGDLTSFMEGDYAGWQETVYQQPVPLNVTYRNISELMPDLNRAAAMRTAIMTYLTNAGKEMKTTDKGYCAAPPGTTVSDPKKNIPDPPTADYESLPRVNKRTIPIRTATTLPELRASTVGLAYDVIKGETTHALFDSSTYTNNNQFYDPMRKSQYAYPDSTAVSLEADACIKLELHNLLTASAMAELWMDASAFYLSFPGAKGQFLPAMAFMQAQAGFSAAVILQDAIMFSAEVAFDLLDIRQEWDSPLLPDVAADFAALSPDDPKHPGYKAFFDKYGTNFAASNSFGGYCNFTVAIEAEVAAGVGFTIASEAAAFELMKIFNTIKLKSIIDQFVHNIHEPSASVRAKISAASSISFTCVGGEPALMGTAKNPAPGGWDKWLKTVHSNPAPIPRKFQLEPLFYLQPTFAARQTMKQATLDYLTGTNGTNTLESTKPRMDRLDSMPTNMEHLWEEEPFDDTEIVLAVPGACTGGGNVGVGCTYHGENLDYYGVTLRPQKSIVQMDTCDPYCYLHPKYKGCDECSWQDNLHPDYTYRVPPNLQVNAQPSAGGCLLNQTTAFVDNFTDYTSHTYKSGGWFSHHSRTTTDYFHEYWHDESSMGLNWRVWKSHNITSPGTLTPSWEFKRAVSQLPEDFGDGSHYHEFLRDYGTHYTKYSNQGGSITLTTYFQSCMLNIYEQQCVTESSGGLIHILTGGGGGKWCSQITDDMYEANSKYDLKMVGGDAVKIGPVRVNSTLDAESVEKWAATIFANKMTPLKIDIAKVTDLMEPSFANDIIVSNVEKAMTQRFQAIQDDQDSWVAWLKANDPMTKPAWCHSTHVHPMKPLSAEASPPLSEEANGGMMCSLD